MESSEAEFLLQKSYFILNRNGQALVALPCSDTGCGLLRSVSSTRIKVQEDPDGIAEEGGQQLALLVSVAEQ